jgi:DNA-binding CsgD family transcriptional regulator
MSEQNGERKAGGRRVPTEFTPVERRMLQVLSDGLPHTPQELHSCLWDDQGEVANIRRHIYEMRQKLRPKGHDIVCEVNRRQTFYRHVRLLVDPNMG